MHRQRRTLFAALVATSIVTASPLVAEPPKPEKTGLEGQTYYAPSDPQVVAALDEWRDMKFGMLIHWGAYSQWGIVESWSLCSEDEGWCVRKDDDYTRYKSDYERLKTTFNPVEYDPSRWASAARRAGMKYVVFTTKHHDGFCMFDTQQTDYKVTDPGCPFHTHQRADVTGELFDAFRSEGLKVGAYFSKPDWHSQDYWWSNFATPDRNPNYDINRYPERWERFVKFTQAQITELLSNYGRVDILWLDGGWVRKLSDEQVVEARNNPESQVLRPQSQDIRMDEIVAASRELQPGLIVVDRAVEGPHQNYLTPENRIPNESAELPWESCMISSDGGWSFVPDSTTIPAHEAIRRLLDVVSKGGNLLLNFAPGPDGDFAPGSYRLLDELAAWISVNGEAIYGTRIAPELRVDQTFFTQSKDAAEVFAIYLGDENATSPPREVVVPFLAADKVKAIEMLGAKEAPTWAGRGEGLMIRTPDAAMRTPPCKTAWSFKISLR